MINRVLIRMKVVQILYAYYQNGNRSPESGMKELDFSLNKAYDLYNELLYLPVEITDHARQRIEAARHKYRPTQEELNPNEKFIRNRFVAQLAQNEELQNNLSNRKSDSPDKANYLKIFFDQIAQTPAYLEYMNSGNSSYEEDKELWRKLYKTYITGNEEIEQMLEEQSLYWNGDKDIIDTFVLKSIRRFEEKEGAKQSLLPKYANTEDYEYAVKLFRKSLEEAETYRQYIDQSLRNWESERIALMDQVILQIAVAEITSFPDIPINVSLNEYIEIAKQYSTPNSASFINGTLAGIVNQLKKEGKLLKK